MRVVERLEDEIQQSLQLVKIHHDADRVERGGSDRNLHAPIVAMQRLKRTIIKPKLMGRGEVSGCCDGKRHLIQMNSNWKQIVLRHV